MILARTSKKKFSNQIILNLDAAATPSSLQAYSFAGSVDIAGSINNK